jgi:hypothetical protein
MLRQFLSAGYRDLFDAERNYAAVVALRAREVV